MSSVPETSQNYARTFNRFELKYIVDYRQAQQLLKQIAPYVVPDRHAGPGGQYRINSLYYDSPELTAFWEKLDGVKFRRKVRIRTYGLQEPEDAFLEIKQRIDRTVQKRRTRAPLAKLIDWLGNNGQEPPNSEDLVIQEVAWLANTYRLQPKVITSYSREAYFGRYESGLRITFDKNIRWSAFHGRLTSSPWNSPLLLPASQFLLEVKCNEAIPSWICSCLNSLDLVTERYSKYCGAINQHVYHGRLL